MKEPLPDSLVIRLVNLDPTPDGFHIFRNFTEDVWAELRHDPRVRAEMDDGPAGGRMMVLRVRTGMKDRVTSRIAEMVRKNRVDGKVRIEAAGSPKV